MPRRRSVKGITDLANIDRIIDDLESKINEIIVSDLEYDELTANYLIEEECWNEWENDLVKTATIDAYEYCIALLEDLY